MSHTIRIRIKRAEGSLIRVLGLIFRRGFEVAQLTAGRTEDGRWIDVTAVVESDRPADVLCRQIEKLFDVVHVQLVVPAPVGAPALKEIIR